MYGLNFRSGLEQEDMRIMYKYLTTSLFPTYMEQELHGAQNRPPSGFGHFGKLVMLPFFLSVLMIKKI